VSGASPTIVEWDPSRLVELVELCAAALPEESLGLDDLEALCTDERVVVLATDDGSGAVVVGLDDEAAGGDAVAQLQLLVVHPARRRRGTARALVAAAEAWALERGAGTMGVGAGAPFYLFSGVDTRWTEALCLFEALGYDRTEVLLDLSCPTLQRRRPAPPGVHVEPVRSDAHVEQLVGFSAAHHPQWRREFERGGRNGTAVLAIGPDGEVLGAAAHSVSRLGVVGPVAVRAGGRHSGVGSALMAAVLGELAVAGLRTAEIAWTSTVGFYAKACGARVGRASQVHRRALVGPEQG
jgi:GNAT superfamily N-acetyltransferase